MRLNRIIFYFLSLCPFLSSFSLRASDLYLNLGIPLGSVGLSYKWTSFELGMSLPTKSGLGIFGAYHFSTRNPTFNVFAAPNVHFFTLFPEGGGVSFAGWPGIGLGLEAILSRLLFRLQVVVPFFAIQAAHLSLSLGFRLK